jgi:hypothetical protein
LYFHVQKLIRAVVVCVLMNSFDSQSSGRQKRRKHVVTDEELVEQRHSSSMFGATAAGERDVVRATTMSITADNALLAAIDAGFMAWHGDTSRMLDRFDARFVCFNLLYCCCLWLFCVFSFLFVVVSRAKFQTNPKRVMISKSNDDIIIIYCY